MEAAYLPRSLSLCRGPHRQSWQGKAACICSMCDAIDKGPRPSNLTHFMAAPPRSDVHALVHSKPHVAGWRSDRAGPAHQTVRGAEGHDINVAYQ